MGFVIGLEDVGRHIDREYKMEEGKEEREIRDARSHSLGCEASVNSGYLL
jgi:hypothetical protein